MPQGSKESLEVQGEVDDTFGSVLPDKSILLCGKDMGHDLLEGRPLICRLGDISTECPRTKTRNTLCTHLAQRSRDPSGLSMGEMNCVVGRQTTS